MLSGSAQLSSVISFRDNHSGISRGLQKASAAVSKNTGESTLIDAFQEIQHQCEQISLPKVVSDSAKQLFKRQEEERLLKAKKRPAIIAACIFIACRDQRVERAIKEIISLVGVSKREFAQCFSVMQRAFGTSSANVHESSAAGIVGRFCSHLGLPPAVQSATIEVVKKIDETGVLAGRSPLSVAAACLYFSSHAFGMGKPVKDIGQVAGISESTLRTSYRYGSRLARKARKLTRLNRILLTKRDQLLAPKWFTERGANSIVADLGRIPNAGDKDAVKAEKA